ncbi:hypothetical protein BDY19DRAFT_997043 [Irpex rosettiformis]|uniref:Uncharacterized protein n=1 Tax=Irpex rosettiformis TaxID=378272 RepID=A0ACB8TSZ0_9APHY|nr:hypothetical protein BDY19DRAFT_997043 [Irpex rosettiformis]
MDDHTTTGDGETSPRPATDLRSSNPEAYDESVEWSKKKKKKRMDRMRMDRMRMKKVMEEEAQREHNTTSKPTLEAFQPVLDMHKSANSQPCTDATTCGGRRPSPAPVGGNVEPVQKETWGNKVEHEIKSSPTAFSPIPADVPNLPDNGESTEAPTTLSSKLEGLLDEPQEPPVVSKPPSFEDSPRVPESLSLPEPPLVPEPPAMVETLLDPIPLPSMWDDFVSRREQLLQAAIYDSVRSGTFHNVEIYAYNNRERAFGLAHVPTVIYARTSFLEASSPVLKELLQSGKRQLSKVPSSTRDYEYLDDSDLEDDELEEVDTTADQASEISDIASNVSAFDLLDSPSLAGRKRHSEIHDPQSDSNHEVIYAPFGAAKTWRVLMAYLYDGSVSFSSLRMSSSSLKSDTSCSPKSMYRLATTLGLTELAKVCEDAIVRDLGPSNVVGELFNDFTWRYPDVLSREVEVFMEHSANTSTRSDLKQAFENMASGKLPRRDVVLSALFDNMLPPTSIVV